MNLSGWQFLVLSPIFSIHWGLQKKKGRPTWRERQNSNNRNKFQQFKKEIFAKYNRDYKIEERKEQKREQKTKSMEKSGKVVKGYKKAFRIQRSSTEKEM